MSQWINDPGTQQQLWDLKQNLRFGPFEMVEGCLEFMNFMHFLQLVILSS